MVLRLRSRGWAGGPGATPIAYRESGGLKMRDSPSTVAPKMHRADDTAPIPRWVKMLGLVAIVLVSIVLVLHLAGLVPIGHGPGR